MACDADTLIADAYANGYPKLSDRDLRECIVATACAGGAGGGLTLNDFFREGNYGGAEPNWTPTGAVGLAIDTSTTPGTQWTYYNGAWN